jgi:archaemetzincin
MELLVDLYRLGAPKECKVLGIASVDLFVPVLTFVFGQAQLGNRAAVLSTYRLHQDFYGLPEDEDLFFHRCEKEAVHELGHTFGLVHCRDSECVMHLSNAIEQVDQKTAAFCEVCKERWEESVRQSGVRPSAELLRACEAHSGSGLDSLLERAGGANRRPAWFNPNGC